MASCLPVSGRSAGDDASSTLRLADDRLSRHVVRAALRTPVPAAGAARLAAHMGGARGARRALLARAIGEARVREPAQDALSPAVAAVGARDREPGQRAPLRRGHRRVGVRERAGRRPTAGRAGAAPRGPPRGLRRRCERSVVELARLRARSPARRLARRRAALSRSGHGAGRRRRAVVSAARGGSARRGGAARAHDVACTQRPVGAIPSRLSRVLAAARARSRACAERRAAVAA